MADRDPTDQQFDRRDPPGRTKDKAAERNPGLEDSIDKAQENQSEVRPEDYPEKAGDVPL
jgi:hypothetical protein